MKSNIM